MRIRKGDNCNYELTNIILPISQQVENKSNEIVYWGEVFILFYYEKLKRQLQIGFHFHETTIFNSYKSQGAYKTEVWTLCLTVLSLLSDISWLITYNFLLGKKTMKKRHKETLIDSTKDLFAP